MYLQLSQDLRNSPRVAKREDEPQAARDVLTFTFEASSAPSVSTPSLLLISPDYSDSLIYLPQMTKIFLRFSPDY